MVRKAKPTGDLQDAIDEVIADLPHHFAKAFFDKKLPSIGVEPKKRFIDKLVDHVLAAGDDEIHFEEIDDDLLANLTITDEDLEELDRNTKEFVRKELPRILAESALDGGKRITKALKRNWPEQHAWQREADVGFRARLEIRWGKALDLLRMLLTISQEIGGEALQRARRSRARKNLHRTDVIIRLHARACQVAAEITTLLENGFADGAMARWRTLYEIGIVVALISVNDDELAERYLAHEIIESKKAMDLYCQTYEGLGYKPPSQHEIDRLNKMTAETVAKHGVEITREYGWATKHLGHSDPKFRHLQEAAGRAMMRSHYKLASHNVHAGVKGVTFQLGSLGEKRPLISGASNAGLDEPGQHAAITLTQITLALFNWRRPFDDLVKTHILTNLQTEAVDAFVRAGAKLKRDSAKYD